MMVYCERGGPGWFVEPLNLASSLAFFVSAWQAWRQLDRSRWREQWDLHLLAALIALIGLTSVLWHASGIPGLFWWDLGALLIFVSAYWAVFLARTQAWKGLIVLPIWFMTISVTVGLAAGLPAEPLGGVLTVLPFVGLLLIGAGLAARVDRRLARDLVFANMILLCGLGLRALDGPLCTWVVVGTHWLWQLLLAGVVFLLVDGLLRHVRLREEQMNQGAAEDV